MELHLRGSTPACVYFLSVIFCMAIINFCDYFYQGQLQEHLLKLTLY